MADCLKLVDEQLEKQRVKRDVDVRELYLADKQLTEVIDLSRFKNLKFLWLNGNRLRRVSCLSQTFRLSELYLQGNCLVDVTGVLAHLTTLQVLFLQNNQLEKLDKVVKELKSIQHLHTLNLFDNPIAQEAEYRPYVIHHVPSITLLDRKEVSVAERNEGRELYDQENKEVAERIAFGRRSEGPPALYYPSSGHLQRTQPASYEVGNNFYRDNQYSSRSSQSDTMIHHGRCAPLRGHSVHCECIQPHLSPPFATEDQAIKVRHLRRSVMEYTTFDWSKVPRAEQRRLSNQQFDKPQVVTTRFR